MIEEGQVILFPFPLTSQERGKLRPALVLKKLPGPYNDWLICMISTQLRHEIPDFDDIVHTDADFPTSGLKQASLIRLSRVAVIEEEMISGSIGKIAKERLQRIRERFSQWIGWHSESE